MSHVTASIEKAGIPTVTIVGSIFPGVARNAMAGMGFSELPMVVVPQGVLTGEVNEFEPAFTAIIDDIISGLTVWKPKTSARVIEPEPKIFTIEGESYQQTVDKMNRLFLQHDWGDGLPLTPPTEERVEWLLTGTDLPSDEVIGAVPPRRGRASVEAITINAAMAGARPEYMPVIIAAMKAMVNPQFALDQLQATVNPVAPLIIVNGPITKEIPINSGFGLFGPTPRFPAGAAIGRALRFIMNHLGGAVPGATDMAAHGQPGKYTGLVIAEAEELSPWQPLSVERGYSPANNTVTLIGVMGGTNYCCLADTTYAGNYLEGITRFIGVPNMNYFFTVMMRGGEPMNAGLLLLGPADAKALAEKGLSKEEVKSYLFEKARIRLSDFISYISLPMGWNGRVPPGLEEMPLDTLVPVAHSPESFLVVVAGGTMPGHWQWLPVGHGGTTAITVEIELPANWKGLLAEAQV